MIEGLSGALFGALAGGLVSWLVTAWQLRQQRNDRVRDAQLDLVRRAVRHKDGSEIGTVLNEVPVVFSGDREALELYLKALPDADRVDMDRVVRLLEHLAKAVGLPVQSEHLTRGFRS